MLRVTGEKSDIRAFFAGSVGVDDIVLLSQLTAHATCRLLKKGDRLVEPGERQTEVWFLDSGITHSLLVDADGREVTDCIMSRRGLPVMPCADLFDPSPVAIEALTDVSVIGVSLPYVQKLLGQSMAASQLYARLLREAWKMHWDVKSVMRICHARERYLWFLEAYPGVVDVVPARHIASFLGMTPVTLSRAKRAIAEEAALREREG